MIPTALSAFHRVEALVQRKTLLSDNKVKQLYIFQMHHNLHSSEL